MHFLLTLLHHNLQPPSPSVPPSPLLQLDGCICFASTPNTNPPPPATANSFTLTPIPPPTLTPANANSSTQTPTAPSALTPATANSSSQTTDDQTSVLSDEIKRKTWYYQSSKLHKTKLVYSRLPPGYCPQYKNLLPSTLNFVIYYVNDTIIFCFTYPYLNLMESKILISTLILCDFLYNSIILCFNKYHENKQRFCIL